MYEQDESTSKRISFQSIFSSLCTLHQGGQYDFSQLEDMANAINGRLHQKYSVPEGIKSMPTNQPQEEKCGKCGGPMRYKEGVKNGNKWRGQFCSNRNCKNVVWLPRTDPDKARQEDDILDQSNQNYDREIPQQYR